MSASQTENARKIAEVIMRSLNSMMAEFRRGKDKQPRKKRTLSSAIQKGAGIGIQAALGAGMLGGAAYAISRGKKTFRESGLPFNPIKDSATLGLLGAGGGAYTGLMYSPAAAIAGGAAGAGLYGVSKLKDRNKNNRSPLSILKK